MKKFILLGLLISSSLYAHEPFVSTPTNMTTNNHVLVTSGYTEEALNTEVALKNVTFNVVEPNNNIQTITPEPQLKSATVFDLPLAIDGTYQISSKISKQLQYTYFNNEWRPFFDIAADKVAPLSERTFLIPSDFKTPPQLSEVTREWTIQNYLSKKHSSAITYSVNNAIKVQFSTNPTEIKAHQPITLDISYDGKPLNNANVTLRSVGQTTKQAQHFVSDMAGKVSITFPQAGQYLVSVTPTVDGKVKPSTQRYTLISLTVQ